MLPSGGPGFANTDALGDCLAGRVRLEAPGGALHGAVRELDPGDGWGTKEDALLVPKDCRMADSVGMILDLGECLED